jgi:hypothetical protein
MISREPQDLDIGCTVEIVTRSAVGPVVIRAEISLTHLPLDHEDPREPDDIVIHYDKVGGGELEYLSGTLNVLADTLRDAQ